MGNNITQIILSVLQYLAWPTVVIVLAIMFRKQLQGLTRIRIRDYEMEIKNEINKISQDVTRVNPDWKVNSTQFLKDNMLELAERSPLALVLQAWEIFDNMIYKATESYGDYKTYTAGAILQDLYDQQYIGKESVNLYFRILALKTKMCNFENEKVTKARAIEFSDTILSIAQTIVSTLEIKKQI